jgi:23S rRNA (pseudouridine1915-N3)-methyltransferase
MKIKLLMIGKTDAPYLREGTSEYENRIRRYVPFETVVIPALKNMSALPVSEARHRESELLMKAAGETDYLVLLDETGKAISSVEFSGFLNARFSSGIRSMVFLIGGPYGVSEAVKKRSNHILSLSRMTFSHQMVRLFFLEQLYRGLTILNNESYHH